MRVITPIPDHMDLLFESPFTGERTDSGHRAIELFAADSASGDTLRITHGRHVHNHFSVSPDRRYIAANRIVEDTNGNGKLDVWDKKTLFVLDLETGVETELHPELDAGYGGVDWSLDGEWIYLSCAIPAVPRSVDIYRMRPDGRDLTKITGGIERQLGPDDANGKFVSDVGVSHDGEWITFVYVPRFPVHRDVSSSIAVARVDGTDAHWVTDGGPLPPVKRGDWHNGDFDPEFSPDGRQVVFSRQTDTGINGPLSSGDIVVCDVDGSNVSVVTEPGDPAGKGIPDWSDDGRIVWMEVDARDGYVGPGIAKSDGSDRQRLPTVRGTHFRWLPGPTKR